MTATTKTPLGGTTVNSKWYLDIDSTPNGGSSTWVPVLGLTNFQPNADEANLADDSDFDSGGFMSQVKTATAWSATCTVARKVQAANVTQYDPGQELLRTTSIGKIGSNSVVHVRFYEMTPAGPRVEAYAGYAAVSWAEQGGDMKALDTVQVTLTGRGQLTIITHPDTAAAVVPVINSLSPAAAGTAGGTLVEVFGTAFTGATAATVGGTAATSFKVISDSILVLVTPAKSAGTYAVAVTNAVGVSTVTQNIVVS